MANIECPGSDTWEKMYGLDGVGAGPFVAFINALLYLILQLAQSYLSDFHAKQCDGECWRRMTGPEFSNSSLDWEQQQDGTWKCSLFTKIKFTIDCALTAGPISNEQLTEELLVQLKTLEKEGK